MLCPRTLLPFLTPPPPLFPPSQHAVTTGDEEWSANIHLLRTVGLANGAQGTRDCIECAYAKSKGCHPDQTGLFACCGDGSFCAVEKQQNSSSTTTTTTEVAAAAKTYFLRYTVTYTNATAAITPITNYVLDASGCEIEYNIAADAQSGVHRTFLCFTYGNSNFPAAGNTPVFAAGHQHIGAINITLSRQRGGKSTPLCTSYPTVGTKVGVAGNEKGYVTAMSHCAGADFKGMQLEKGDDMCVESFYDVDPADKRSAPLPGGAHLGVMSLFYLVVA